MLLRVLLDEQLGGFRDYLAAISRSPALAIFTEELGLEFIDFPAAGLRRSEPDRVVWQTCLANDWFLLTNNRNAEGPDSLGAMILSEPAATAWPVFTVGDMDRFRNDGEYASQLVERILEKLYDRELLKGSGRVFVP